MVGVGFRRLLAITLARSKFYKMLYLRAVLLNIRPSLTDEIPE